MALHQLQDLVKDGVTPAPGPCQGWCYTSSRTLSRMLLHQLQDLDGALAVGGHHDVAVLAPGHGTHKLVDILVLALPVQEGSHSVKLELEQMLTQT